VLTMNESPRELIDLYKSSEAPVESGGAADPTHQTIFQGKLNEIFPPE